LESVCPHMFVCSCVAILVAEYHSPESPAKLKHTGQAMLAEQESSPQLMCQPCDGGITILDGGMGHQLKAMGVEITGPVGSLRRFLGVAVANVERPEMVKDAHLAYIDAGAEIITSNNYACVPKCLEFDSKDDALLSKYGVAGMVAAAGKVAQASCHERPDSKAKVAGSLPPLAESYRADKVGPFEENLRQYEVIAKSIAPYCDLLLCETMSTADEARAAVTAAANTDLPIWVSWTLKENEPVLRSGESINDAVEAVKSVKGAKIEACLFNCTSPESITAAMPILRELVPSMRIGGFANGFCTAESGQGEYRDLSPEEYYDSFVAKWIESGATIVGGCCGVFPAHIAHMRKVLVPTASL